MPETTPLLSGADGGNYYFLNNGTTGTTPLVRDADGGATVEDIPEGSNATEFEPKKLGPRRQVRRFRIPCERAQTIIASMELDPTLFDLAITTITLG